MKICTFISSSMIILTCGFGSYASADVYNVFTDIYKRGEWGRDASGEGISGVGSIYKNAVPYVNFVQQFLVEHNIRTVVDIGCGDWELSRHINWGGIQYTGIDVVESVITKNCAKYGSKNIQFCCVDGIHADLPKADLLICKDVLQHLPNEYVQTLITKLNRFKYCLLTNDISAPGFSPSRVEGFTNIDIAMGHGRFINFSLPPFSVQGSPVLHYSSPGTVKEVFLVTNPAWVDLE